MCNKQMKSDMIAAAKKQLESCFLSLVMKVKSQMNPTEIAELLGSSLGNALYEMSNETDPDGLVATHVKRTLEARSQGITL